jgi:hypothetical protein
VGAAASWLMEYRCSYLLLLMLLLLLLLPEPLQQ